MLLTVVLLAVLVILFLLFAGYGASVRRGILVDALIVMGIVAILYVLFGPTRLYVLFGPARP